MPQRTAAAIGVALVCPDTSPRGLGVEGEAESWDFGVGAGFYLNATQVCWRHGHQLLDVDFDVYLPAGVPIHLMCLTCCAWSCLLRTQERWKNWRMYAYVTEELPLVLRELPSLDVHTVRLPNQKPHEAEGL